MRGGVLAYVSRKDRPVIAYSNVGLLPSALLPAESIGSAGELNMGRFLLLQAQKECSNSKALAFSA